MLQVYLRYEGWILPERTKHVIAGHLRPKAERAGRGMMVGLGGEARRFWLGDVEHW
ncbi:hypothetical protein OCK74_07225 [Chitinophagaceae bacterium LB-8]|uniref:Uncharacterized protein n=1 Tax=Paraflavisolibacter caeni TaxID=2982496 RepID=A0A9X3BHN6_9BACT|nr:hypothetical protein [Paraflavisolibacter caeni]MCU7548903.1 hypothetical protein [Paraflavisolibacter caeni]